jgi:uncharacterized membrane protein YhaH (DUF805 family)
MTRKEFSENYDHYTRSGRRYSFWMVCALGLLMIVEAVLANEFNQTGNVTAWSMGIVWALYIVGVVLLDGWSANKFDLKCPVCRRRLISVDARRKLLVTGNCFKCGNKVFDEQTGAYAVTSWHLDREGFRTKLENFKRQTSREATRALVIMSVICAICIPATKYFQRLVDRGGLDWVILTQWRGFVILMFATVAVAAVGIFIFAFKGKLNVHHLPCPECNRSPVGIGAKPVLETGMCIYCGCRLFDDPSSEDVGGVSL